MEEIKAVQISALPILNQYIEDLQIPKILSGLLKGGREEVPTHKVLTVLISNILLSSSPLYKIPEWLKDYSDGIGEFGIEGNKYNDKRVGRALDELYESDRHSMMTAISTNAIKLHELDTSEIHNDSTTISFSGSAYDKQTEGSVAITRGYNKDHRPDYKQIVYGLNICGDGHIPLLASLYDGNRTDDTTHIVNWESLKDFLKQADFIYLADSKVSTTENLTYIAGKGGKFISILPKTRKEVQDFYKELQAAPLEGEKKVAAKDWLVGYEKESSRKKGKYTTYRLYEGEKTKEGFDIIWVHSSAKAKLDEQIRLDGIAKVRKKLIEFLPKLNTYYLKTEQSIQKRLDNILGKQKEFFDIELIKTIRVEKKKIGRGRIGPNSKFKEEQIIQYELKWGLNEKAEQSAAKIDGIFPLVSNTQLGGKKILETYKNQPYLEKRFSNLKSVLEVAPVFLKKPQRIEAILFLYFLALMVMALMERRIRLNMKEQGIKSLPILPQKAKTEKPTWNNIRYFFKSIIAMSIVIGIDFNRFLVKGLTPNHKLVLDLLEVPIDLYTNPLSVDWWSAKQTIPNPKLQVESESDKLVEKSAPSPMKIVHKIEDIEPLVSTNSNQIRCG